MPETTGRNTTRQREAAAASRRETARRLLDAAALEFGERGYAGATVSRIANQAGVTVQTLYLAWGSKRALLRAYLERALAGEDDTPYPQLLPRLIEERLASANGNPMLIIAAAAHLFCDIAERAALGWTLYRDAASVDALVAEDWLLLQELRRRPCGVIAQRLPEHSLREDLALEQAAETLWVIQSPETYDLLVRVAGRTRDEYEQWLTTTLCHALLR
jgi:AcrR family transcriptional regulator